jgi:hypothetical protein
VKQSEGVYVAVVDVVLGLRGRPLAFDSVQPSSTLSLSSLLTMRMAVAAPELLSAELLAAERLAAEELPQVVLDCLHSFE